METTFAALPAVPAAIQKASWRDLIAVRQLEDICFPKDSWPLLDIIGVLTLPNVVRLKAIANDQMVGFVAGDYRRGKNISWIATIGVLPEYRGRGIGKALLRECEARLNTVQVRLCVRRSNRLAIELYERSDYRQVGIWHGYYQDGEDALVFEKQRAGGTRRDLL